MNSMPVLIVVGSFDHDKGKQSYFGSNLINTFLSIFDKIDHLNGGNIVDLDACMKKIKQYKVIVWMPNIDNSVDKYLPTIKATNKTCILIQSKRNDEEKYTTFQIIERMFKVHSNLCLVINKQTSTLFKIIDPLGNIWFNSNDIIAASLKLAQLTNYITGLTRIPSVQDFFKGKIIIEESFISIINFYGWLFSSLINTAINKERFLGNVSTRCMHGFPSMKKDGVILVSRRNIDKENITSDGFVPVTNDESIVRYSGAYKPSVDTPTQIRLYNYYKEVNYIIHGHTYVPDALCTKKFVPCGYIEEFKEITNIYKSPLAYNFSINLPGHGCIVLAKHIAYLSKVNMIARDFPEDMTNHILTDAAL